MGVATAIAIGGLAISAATTTKSFIDANNQKKLQKEAEQDAKNAMDAARKKLEVNFFDQMAVKKEPYELEREAMLAQGAQAIQAGQEQDRGAAATAGRVQMAMNEGQAGIRTAMGKEMTDIEKMQLAEESRLRDIGIQLDLGEVEGAQLAARDAQQAAAAATAQGWEGVANTAQQGLDMIPLFLKTPVQKERQKFEAVPTMTTRNTEVNRGLAPRQSPMVNTEFNRGLPPRQSPMVFTQPHLAPQPYNPFNILPQPQMGPQPYNSFNIYTK